MAGRGSTLDSRGEPGSIYYARFCILLSHPNPSESRYLRSVFIPSVLRDAFLNIAKPNTDCNLETCGILCGKLVISPFGMT